MVERVGVRARGGVLVVEVDVFLVAEAGVRVLVVEAGVVESDVYHDVMVLVVEGDVVVSVVVVVVAVVVVAVVVAGLPFLDEMPRHASLQKQTRTSTTSSSLPSLKNKHPGGEEKRSRDIRVGVRSPSELWWFTRSFWCDDI